MTTKEARLARKVPTCDLCGAKHWPRQPHVLAPGTRGKLTRTPAKARETTAQPTPIAGDHRGRSFDAPGKAWIGNCALDTANVDCGVCACTEQASGGLPAIRRCLR